MIECGQTLNIANDDQVFFEQKSQFGNHGSLLRAFQSTDNTEFLMVFADLSLQYVQGGKKMWEMEQALSKVVQVEIFDSATLAENKKSELNYVQQMSKPTTWLEVPSRIV